MKKKYKNEQGKKPTEVYLTPEDELELEGLGTKEIDGKLVSRIMKDGVREAFPRICGMTVHWDSQKTYVK